MYYSLGHVEEPYMYIPCLGEVHFLFFYKEGLHIHVSLAFKMDAADSETNIFQETLQKHCILKLP